MYSKNKGIDMVLCNSLKMQFAENVRKSPAESLMTRSSSHRIVRELHAGVNMMRLFPRSSKNVDFEFGDQLEMKAHAQFEPEESGASGAHWIIIY